MTTINKIREMLAAGAIAPLDDDVIKMGVLKAADGRSVDYTLHQGWDIAKCFACDDKWGKFNIRLLDHIEKQKYDDATLDKVFADIQMDDSHWNWFAKACIHNDTSFTWFFLMAEGTPQGACVIYHPKKSVIEAGDIFYVEYVAVAPWNRKNPMAERVFNGVGTLLIKSAVQYVNTKLKMRYGFSLHALPRASEYYAKIGMQRFAAADKDTLEYYEMGEKTASQYGEAA